MEMLRLNQRCHTGVSCGVTVASTGTFHEWRDDCYARNGVYESYECECKARSHGSIPSDFVVDLSDEISSNMLALAGLYCSEKCSFGH